MTEPAVEALLRDHPGVDAEGWVAARRALLTARCLPDADRGLAVSSGCAAGGARTHAHVLAEDAARALQRLDAGLLTRCEACGQVLPWDRLDSAPAAVTCTGCARRDVFDTRWCR
ncbi:MAG: hypothetical protein JWO60_1516 [Frankiales bacterium]|nr:hypothetical protein [Frankiales bacterium]